MRLVLTILVYLLTFNSFSQIASYFSDNPKWSLESMYTPPGTYDCDSTKHYTYWIDGDTLVNNIGYNILRKKWETQVHNGHSSCNFTLTGESIYKLVRQSNDSVFYVNSQGNDELLISYNVDVGQSFSYTSGYVNGFDVLYIDTLNINGQTRRRYHNDTTNNSMYHTYIIEGIGHFKTGFGEFLTDWELDNSYPTFKYLTCFAQGGSVQWQHPNFTTLECDFQEDLSLSEYELVPDFIISPNPFETDIQINNLNHKTPFGIYSIEGIEIILGETDGSINLKGLKTGSYLLVLRVSDSYIVRKIVKL